MINILIILDLAFIALIFGYAFSATAISYPAMMACSRETAVGYFSPFFHKSANTQLILSLAIIPLSFAISYLAENWWWLIGSLILQISGPYTIFILMPVNNRIMAEDADIHSEQMTKDLGAWGKLHLPRTVLAAAIFFLFAYLAVSAH